MLPRLSDTVRQAISRADEVARDLNHEFIGTEHLLLGLLESGTSALAATLQSCGLNTRQIRAQILRMVQAGPQPSTERNLPFTPRANQAIEFAAQEAWGVHQEQIGPAHLLLGLLRETDGVAGQLLLGLGLSLDAARSHLLAGRLEQLKFVERIVRDIPAGFACKRKLREELLSHLTEIYEEELARLKIPEAAWQSAADRFGKPTELARELRRSLSLRERINDLIERRLGIGWRPPETATHWMARWALQMAVLLAGLNVLAAIWIVAAAGINPGAWAAIRAIGLMSLCLPLLQFIVGTAFFKMRDALFGVFGTRKSNLTAAAMAALMSLAIAATFTAFITLTVGRIDDPVQLAAIALASIGTPLFAFFVIRTDGPQEVRDTLWACLDLDESSGCGAAPAEPAS